MSATSSPLFGSPVANWTPWFAWRPVRTYDGRRRLFWMVERRLIQKHQFLDGGADFWWQYKVRS